MTVSDKPSVVETPTPTDSIGATVPLADIVPSIINIFKDNADVQKERAELYKMLSDVYEKELKETEGRLTECENKFSEFKEECHKEISAEYETKVATLNEECERKVAYERELKEKLINGSEFITERCEYINRQFLELSVLYNAMLVNCGDFQGKAELCTKINTVIANYNNATTYIGDFTKVLNEVKNGVVGNE